MGEDYRENNNKCDIDIGKSVWFYAGKINNGAIILCKIAGRKGKK